MVPLCGCFLAFAQPTLDHLALAQLPSWAQPSFENDAFRAHYLFDLSVNPFFQSGDFDKDGFLDLAVLVRNIQTGQRGVALLLQEDSTPFMLETGENKTTADLSWLVVWHVEQRLPAGAGLEHEGHVLVLSGLNGEALWVFRDASAWRTVIP